MFRYILTAGHCFENVTNINNININITLGRDMSNCLKKTFLLNQVNMTETEEQTMKCTELLELTFYIQITLLEDLN